MNNKRAILYYRTSGKSGKANEGFGYETQRDECREYCKANNIEIEAEYFSNGISGELIDQDSALMEMLSNLNGQDYIIAKSSCRILGRSDYRQAWVKRELVKAEKKLICLDQPDFNIYEDDPTQVFMNKILEAVDVFDKMNIVLKLHKARRQKVIKTSQKAAGKAPFGFRWVDKKIEADEALRTAVEAIFLLGARGTSCRRIAEVIETEYHVTMSGPRINGILKNRFYLGEVTYGSTATTNDSFQLINKITFGKAQKALTRNKK